MEEKEITLRMIPRFDSLEPVCKSKQCHNRDMNKNDYFNVNIHENKIRKLFKFLKKHLMYPYLSHQCD